MAKIQLSQRMYSILDIARLLKSGELSIQPKYQRRRTAWPVNAKTALLDTVLNNFPLPPIYLRDYVDDSGKRRKEIIDGQQRISTIVEFFNDEFSLSNNIFDPELYSCKFSDLPIEEQQMIEDFEVSFISIRGASDSDIISIFSRLNSFSLPLNSQEKLNSLYVGEMKTLIYELASEYNTFWTEFKILTPSAIARMNDASLVSEILHTIIFGWKSASTKSIERMYRQFDEEFKQKSEVEDNFNQTISIIGALFETEVINKVFKPKFMFYSLFLAIYARLFGFEGAEKEKTGEIDVCETGRNLENFAYEYTSLAFDPERKSKFKQATGNVAQRKFRHKEMSNLVV